MPRPEGMTVFVTAYDQRAIRALRLFNVSNPRGRRFHVEEENARTAKFGCRPDPGGRRKNTVTLQDACGPLSTYHGDVPPGRFVPYLSQKGSYMANSPRSAVILLSGGLDSTTTLAIAKHEGFTPYAMSFRYGQRHQVELESARKVAAVMGVAQHIIVDIDLRQFGGSALTSDLNVPKSRSLTEMGEGIPVTYVPARNTVFLSFALAWAETLGAHNIFLGVNALDYSGYPDCRPEFIAAFEAMANLATRAGVQGTSRLRIHTPLISLTKAETIARGLALGVDYSLTSSCYDPAPSGEPCGACDSCLLRAKGFSEVALDDPLVIRFKAA